MGIIELLFFITGFVAMVLFAYISWTKIKPTVERYTDIDWFRTKTFEKYRLLYLGYRKICRENGLSLRYSNILNTITIIFFILFFVVVFTAF